MKLMQVMEFLRGLVRSQKKKVVGGGGGEEGGKQRIG